MKLNLTIFSSEPAEVTVDQLVSCASTVFADPPIQVAPSAVEVTSAVNLQQSALPSGLGVSDEQRQEFGNSSHGEV